MEELKPCPFCGSEAEIKKYYSKENYAEKHDNPDWKLFDVWERDPYKNGRVPVTYWYFVPHFTVRCKNKHCICRVTRRFDTECEAIEGWNRRVKGGDAP